MKAVIVEIKDEFASVLSDDGCVLKIKNNGYEIGQVIQMKSPKTNITKKLMTFTASAAAVLLLSIGSWAYASPYSYVSLDVNPSIEYIVNRFDRVLRVKSVNDDGEEILKEIKLDNLKNHTIQNALAATVEQISEAGYFNGTEEGGIVIATSAKDLNKAEQLAESLQFAVQDEIEQNGDTVQLEVISVIPDRVKEAQALGVTPGKLNLVEKLQQNAVDPDSIILEEWLNKPVKEIMKATKDYKKASDAAELETETDEKAPVTDDNTEIQKDEVSDKKTNDKAAKEQGKAADKADKAQDKSDKSQDKSTVKSGKEQSKADKAFGKTEKEQTKANQKDNNNNNKDKPNKGEDKPAKNNITSSDQNTGQENDKLKPDPSSDKPQKENGNSEKPGKSDNNGNPANQADDKNNKAADKATDEIADKAADSAAYADVDGNINIDSSSEDKKSSADKETNDKAEKDPAEHSTGNANPKENDSSGKPEKDPGQNSNSDKIDL
jgi:hypothetical protein